MNWRKNDRMKPGSQWKEMMRQLLVDYCFYNIWWLLKEPLVFGVLVYLVTALVPSLTACLASSPGRSSLMAVWISQELMVDFFVVASKAGSFRSVAMRSKMSLTNEFMVPMALLELPVSV